MVNFGFFIFFFFCFRFLIFLVPFGSFRSDSELDSDKELDDELEEDFEESEVEGSLFLFFAAVPVVVAFAFVFFLLS